jgi:hypothetical protein
MARHGMAWLQAREWVVELLVLQVLLVLPVLLVWLVLLVLPVLLVFLMLLVLLVLMILLVLPEVLVLPEEDYTLNPGEQNLCLTHVFVTRAGATQFRTLPRVTTTPRRSCAGRSVCLRTGCCLGGYAGIKRTRMPRSGKVFTSRSATCYTSFHA